MLARCLPRLAGRARGELVALAAHMGPRAAQIDLQLLCSTDAGLGELAACSPLRTGVQRHLGGHAAYARAGRPQWAAVDQEEVAAGAAHLAQGIQSCAAGADDRDVGVNLLIHG